VPAVKVRKAIFTSFVLYNKSFGYVVLKDKKSGVQIYVGQRSVTFRYGIQSFTLDISCGCRPSDFHLKCHYKALNTITLTPNPFRL
jgi:hypothetical protein